MKIGKLRISIVRNKSFVDRNNAFANIGESIQAVTMAYIYRECGVDERDIIKIDQCEIKQYQGEEIVLPLRLPLSRDNYDEYFPLPKSIHTVFISLHLHDDIFQGRPDIVEYFKAYEPIGCRDEISCSFFRKYHIEAYMMGCYTLALPKRTCTGKEEQVFLVDVSEKLCKRIPKQLESNSIKLTHAVPYLEYPVTHAEDERLEEEARHYLELYGKKAGLVITSRLHVAAPCIAMGVPVVLASDNADFRYAWIDKFLKIYQESEYEDIDWNPQVIDSEYVRSNLMELLRTIIYEGRPSRTCLKRLDLYYHDRVKTKYYATFRQRLKHLSGYYQDRSFSYAIWGAGNHALFAYQIMKEMYPNAVLQVVVDKYKTGELFGVPIIKGDKLEDYAIEQVCITTNPGKQEAIHKCEEIFGKHAPEHFVVITSQQKS